MIDLSLIGQKGLAKVFDFSVLRKRHKTLPSQRVVRYPPIPVRCLLFSSHSGAVVKEELAVPDIEHRRIGISFPFAPNRRK